MTQYWRTVGALMKKDFLTEGRRLQRLSITGGFALLVVLLFHFAFDVGVGEGVRFFPGALWIALFFACMLGVLGPSGQHNGGHGTAALFVPVDRSALFLARLLFHMALMVTVELVAVPMFMASFGLTTVAHPGLFIAALLLGSWGLVALGTLLGELGGEVGGGLLMPLMLFPLLVPVALGATAVTTAAMTGDVTPVTGTWVKTLLLFDGVFTLLPMLFYEYMLEV